MYARNPSPEVRALLWEVARLRRRLRRADQLRVRSAGPHDGDQASAGHPGGDWAGFALEPCLQQDEPGGWHADVDEELFRGGPGG